MHDCNHTVFSSRFQSVRLNKIKTSTQGNQGSVPYRVLVTKDAVLGCHKQRRFYKIYNHPLIKPQFYFSQCVHNEYMALKDRHHLGFNKDFYTAVSNCYDDESNLKPNDQIDFEDLNIKLHFCRIKIAEELGNFYNINYHYNRQTILSKLRSTVKKRYILANNKIQGGRLYNFEGKHPTAAFIKWEKMCESKINGTARLIQFKSYKFTLWHKVLIQPLVDIDKKNITNFFHQPFNTIRTSGMTQIECAQLFKTEWDTIDNPCAVLLDCSKFDGHIDFRQLELEIIVLENAYKNTLDHSVFDTLLSKLFIKTGYTHHGIKYKADGSRDSGVASTAKGNSDINHCNLRLLILYCISLYLNKEMNYDLLHSIIHYLHVHGDDSVIIVNSSFGKLVYKYANKIMKILGHDIKVEIVYDFEKISYCQCQPINMGNYYKMVREPIRAISRSAYSEKLQPWNKYFAAIGLCELAVHSGVPILQSLGISHILKSGLEKPLRSYVKDTTFAGTEPAILPISDITRWSFFNAFGITIDEQLSIEQGMAPATSNIKQRNLSNFIKSHINFTNNVKSQATN